MDLASTSSAALAAAGDLEGARDVGALDEALAAVDRKLAPVRPGLVERLIYGPVPSVSELQAGGRECARLGAASHPVIEAALEVRRRGEAFGKDGKLSNVLRKRVASAGGYGLTVPKAFGGLGESYLQLAHVEEALSANGLGPLAVELSGELTIGAGSLLGYGSAEQRKAFLPQIARGALMAFALTEVGTGVNAKKIRAYVETDSDGDYRLFATGDSNKLWITNATFGALAGVVARIGKGSRELALFITRLPERDVCASAAGWEFRCEPSGVAAFPANFNSRLHFWNYPIPAQHRVPGDGVEVLFYCLRLGRCMLAAMSAGYQRMLARDATHYAGRRQGVGGLVIKHELPQLAIARMLGGSLQARALAYLALSQDAAGVDLAGLRDLTKSAAAQTGVESMLACEHVMGGRAFSTDARVHAARINLHLFGVVEGEDDMIRMGMVRDVTARFVSRHLAPLLDALSSVNFDEQCNPLAPAARIRRLGLREFLRYPARSLRAVIRLLGHSGTYRLAAWVAREGLREVFGLAAGLVPTVWVARYRALPELLRSHARFGERELRRIRWTYVRLALQFQLELTSAQVSLQRLGHRIEWLVSIVALCHHAASEDESEWHIANLQCLHLREKLRGSRAGLSRRSLHRIRGGLQPIADRLARGTISPFDGLEPEPYTHQWHDGADA